MGRVKQWGFDQAEAIARTYEAQGMHELEAAERGMEEVFGIGPDGPDEPQEDEK